MSSNGRNPNEELDLSNEGEGVDPSGRPVSQVDQLLISYLDGELDERSSAELESRLATDVPLRNRLHEFQQTWDMLDEVQRTEPGDAFVKSTIEMVVSTARKKSLNWNRWAIRVAAGIAAFAIPLTIAFQSVRSYQNLPYRQFVNDLAFWENVDMYDQIDSLEFVERIRSEGWFAGELSNE
jgi:hypothetical protein